MADSTPGFDLNSFEAFWTSLDADARTDIISRAGFFPPLLGILPILQGLFSYHFNERALAGKSLTVLVSALGERLAASGGGRGDPGAEADGVRVGAKIYQRLSPEQTFADKSILVSALAALGNKGAFFAFKALYQDRLSMDVMKKCIQNMTEYQRLVLTDQYLQATPAIRLRFASLFKKVLQEIQDRDPVITFYARLFDRNRDVDPFLNNLPDDLRDPDTIVEKEIRSQNPELRIRGLKALSMILARIPSHVLDAALRKEEVKKVRMAVYSLIENSSLGQYPELFDPVFSRLTRGDTRESVMAFKAMVVTGKYPFHKLIPMVRKTCPEILSQIYLEISDLSRLSFFAIQDIALNKDQYDGDNFDVNQACIFGMIKKRPERVVKILKSFEKKNRSSQKIDLTGFVKKTTRLLTKERESIEAEFRTVQTLQRPEEKGGSFFKAILRDPVQKKLTALREKRPLSVLDFSKKAIRDQDLTGVEFSAASLFFNHTLVENCNMAEIRMGRAACQSAVFHNVNLDGAYFDNVCFDGAFFINVSAIGARFRNCSFLEASFFNCNFNRADLADGMFLDAVISKTTFGHADLACASFFNARISGVSFVTSGLNMTDFSDAKARFCRFPSQSRNVIRTRGMDYNARAHQLSYNDLPRIEPGVANEINMLIFCEFIHYGEAKFFDQNKLSLLTAYDIFKPAQADFFQLLPLLLHENLMLAEMDHLPRSTPCGIADYLPSREAVRVGEKYLGKGQVRAVRNASPYIQGLFSMGSVGSLAQTAESDIDYWVCIDERIMDAEGLGLLRRKLDSLETLAMDIFKIHVTFFMVDILKARHNDFGGSTQESSGSAQSRLLKEEFYRTMIHVAGKLPLWAVLPTPISINYYNLILERTSKLSSYRRHIDLGDIHAIPVNEYFGASIWQMFKWLKSPFKSVIKMALLEKYIHGYGRETLLCNQYKNEWMNSGSHLKPGQNDSYIILLNTLRDFYLKAGDTRSINLLLTCFFLKLGISKPSEIDYSVFGLRKILLSASLAEWGWPFRKIFEIGRFKAWPYAAIQRLSLTIERYMVSKYKELKNRFDTQSGAGLMISEKDRIVLERKVDIMFQQKPNKIKKLLLVSRGDRHFSRLHLRYLPATVTGQGTWELIHKIPKHQNEESIIKADTVEEIGAWLINNHLYTEQTFLGMMPNPTPVSHEDIEKLYRSMHGFFMPELTKTVHFSAMRQQPEITRLFISLNFYAEKPQTVISDYTVVYLNSWGEMYLRSARPGTPIPSLDAAKKEIRIGLSLKAFPQDTAFYFARGVARA